jgi:hypothetical protein
VWGPPVSAEEKEKEKEKGERGSDSGGLLRGRGGLALGRLVRLPATFFCSFFFFFSDFLNLLYLLHFSIKSNQTRIEFFLKF